MLRRRALMRLVSHPTGPVTAWPSPRTESWNPALDDAIVSAHRSETAFAALHQPGALAVTTGQQPGLFAGPIYTIHKALSAVSLAGRLSRDWGRPVVPIFWLAGDDHDFAEASEATWIGWNDELIRWRLPERAAGAPQRSMANELLPPEIDDGLTRLQSSFPEGPDRDALMSWLRTHYVPGVSLHAACRGALAELLSPFGILILDPTHPAFKRAQAPVLGEALRRAEELDARLAALPPSDTGIAVGEGATLIFLETEMGRDRLLIDGAGFRLRRSGQRMSADAVQQTLATTPERFSANVLLRPVVESALLPTVAYVAGPAEMRYLTRQSAALYSALGIPVQLPVPRWGGTLVDPVSERLLQRLQLSAEAVLADRGHLAREILQRDLPHEVSSAITTLSQQIATSTSVLERHAGAIDPGLVRSITERGKRLTALADELERRFERHLKRRGDIAFHQFQRVRTALRPDDGMQERVLSAAGMLGRYGTNWLDMVKVATDRWAATPIDRRAP